MLSSNDFNRVFDNKVLGKKSVLKESSEEFERMNYAGEEQGRYQHENSKSQMYSQLIIQGDKQYTGVNDAFEAAMKVANFAKANNISFVDTIEAAVHAALNVMNCYE